VSKTGILMILMLATFAFRTRAGDVAVPGGAGQTASAAAANSAPTAADPFPACKGVKAQSPISPEERKAALLRLGASEKDQAEFNSALTEIQINCARKNQSWFTDMAQNAPDDMKPLYDYGRCDKVISGTEVFKDADGSAVLVEGVKPKIERLGPQFRVEQELMRRSYGLSGAAVNAVKDLAFLKEPGEQIKLNSEEEREANRIWTEEDNQIKNEITKQVPLFKAKYEELLKQPGMNAYAADHDDRLPRWWKTAKQYDFNFSHPQVKLAMADEVNSRRGQLFAKHFDKYSGILSEVPSLAMLGNRSPGDEDIARAGEKVLVNSKGVTADIAKIMSHPASLDDLMKYGGFVNVYLQQNPKDCAITVGIAHEIQRAKDKRNMLIAGGMIGLSLATMGVAPAVVAAAGGSVIAWSAVAGTALSAFGTSAAYLKYRHNRASSLSVLHATESPDGHSTVAATDANAFLGSRDSLAVSLGLMGLQAGGSAAGIAFQRASTLNAIQTSLQKAGVAESDAKSMIQGLTSADAATQKASALKIGQALKYDPDDMALMEAAARKGFLTTKNRDAINEIRASVDSSRIADVNVRKDIVRKAMQILEQTDTGKLTDEGKTAAMRAALEATRFGVSRPEAVAKSLSSWTNPTQLRGLESTYRGARAVMETDPAIKAMISESGPEAARKAAMNNYLDSLKGRVPEFQTASPQEWTNLKSQISQCSSVGAAR
jgi:hypothetical protein